MTETAAVEQRVRERRDRSLEELFALLRIPSISAMAQHADDVLKAAAWVVSRLQAGGFDARIMPTGGHPAVYGEWLGARGKPTVLVYGHFDVQPADPVALWSSPPFEPTVRNGRIYARGASDDKGNMLPPIVAAEAWLQTHKALPVNLKFLFEGQEEIGSPQMPAFMESHKELLACDVILNADGFQWSETEPNLLEGLRGLCSLEFDVRGASRDLHSGAYGGAVANPLHAIAELVASLHTSDGRVAVKGFYDGVLDLDPAARASIAAVPFDEAAFLSETGVKELYGEPGYGTHERTWVRPTLELNGMWGGFQGDGTKTVLPGEAHAKITCRLVPEQDPDRVLDVVEKHLHAHAPRGVSVTVRRGNGKARPFVVPSDLPAARIVGNVLRGLYGKEPYHVRSGGTIAICELFLRHLGVYSVSFGFGLPDDRLHSPDESFRLSSIEKAETGYCRILAALGEGLR